jgi:hypothetical protein
MGTKTPTNSKRHPSEIDHPGPPDVNELAYNIVQHATNPELRDETEPAPHGQAGGEARAAALTPEERAASARHAAKARWQQPGA